MFLSCTGVCYTKRRIKETLIKRKKSVIRAMNSRLPQKNHQGISKSKSPIFYLILPQIKTPSGEIRDSPEGVLLHDVMRSEGVRGLQRPSGAVCAAAVLVGIAYAECAGSFGGRDSHFAKEAACISHIIGEDI